MQKLAIVSDVHLKLRRYASFELGRFEQLINKLISADINTVIFNGDLLDHARPTLEELSALYNAFDRLHANSIETIIIIGNHEAVTKHLSTYDFINFPHTKLHAQLNSRIIIEDVTLQLCHWNNINSLHELESADILISHYRSAMPGLYEAEIDTSFLSKYDLTILGDIHSRYSPQDNVHYTSSPYSINFTKDTAGYGYIELAIDDGAYTWQYIDLDLPCKTRIDTSYQDLHKFKPEPNHLYRVHVAGTLDELSKLSSYDNVTYIKEVMIHTVSKSTKKADDAPFIDKLVERVNATVAGDNKKTKNILVQLQGDT